MQETECKTTSRGVGEEDDDGANINEQPECGCSCCGDECHIEWTGDD